MSRCDCEGVFYRVFCVSLLVIAFTFTVILTNVFVDIDNLLSKKERESTENIGVIDHVTDNYEATTEIPDYYIGVDTNDEGRYRSKRSLDSENFFLRINSPKTKSYLTNKLASLLEALDDDDSENTTPTPENGNIYIKTVKQKNNIEINELQPEKQMGEDIIYLALHNMLQGIRYVDMHELIEKIKTLVRNFKRGDGQKENKHAETIGEFYSETTPKEIIIVNEEQNLDNEVKYKFGDKGLKRVNAFDFNNAADADNETRTKTTRKNKNPAYILVDIKQHDKKEENSNEDIQGIIKFIYNGKPIKIRSEDSSESTTPVITITTSTSTSSTTTTTTKKNNKKTVENTIKHDVEDFADVLKDKFKNRHMPDTYLKTITMEYLKKFEKSNDSMAAIERKKIRIKRNLESSYEKQTETPHTKDDDELFVEIETHFDKTGMEGEKKRKLVKSIIEKIQKAIRSSHENMPVDRNQREPLLKRIQSPLDRETVAGLAVQHISSVYRTLDPISKSMPIVDPLPLVANQNGETWKKQDSKPKFLSSSKSINSAELNQLSVDYTKDIRYPAIPKRVQLPLSIDSSQENTNAEDLGKLQLLFKDIEGTGFSIGYNQYIDQAPDPESIKLFHGIEDIVRKYHQKNDNPDQLGDHVGEYEMYGQELKKREVNNDETPLRTKRFVMNRQNFRQAVKRVNHHRKNEYNYIYNNHYRSLNTYKEVHDIYKRSTEFRRNNLQGIILKRNGKSSLMNPQRKKRSVTLKTIMNSNKKMRVNKYLNTKTFPRQTRYFRKNKRSKRQVDNSKAIDKTGLVSENNNMLIVSDGDIYNDNIAIKQSQKPDLFFIELMKSNNEDTLLKNKPLFQPSNQPFSSRISEIKKQDPYNTNPVLFKTTSNYFIEKQENKERNKRQLHTLRIIDRDMGQKNSDIYSNQAIIAELDAPQIINRENEERGTEYQFSTLNNIANMYKNPFNFERIIFSNKNPTWERMIENPLMAKYPHIFKDTETREDRSHLKHVQRSKESDTLFNNEDIYQSSNVQDLLKAVVPPHRNNYKVSIRLIPRENDNYTKPGFKEIHTSINKSYNKSGLLYSSQVNVTEISKVEIPDDNINRTHICSHHLNSIIPNINETTKPLEMESGLRNNVLVDRQGNNDEINKGVISNKSSEITTKTNMELNLLDIIIPSSPRKIFHLSVADLGKLLCKTINSQDSEKSSATQAENHTGKTTTMSTTTIEPTTRVTTIKAEKLSTYATTTVDPLKMKLLKAMSQNQQLTSHILDRIDQNTDILQAYLSKISSELAKLPEIYTTTTTTTTTTEKNPVAQKSNKKPAATRHQNVIHSSPLLKKRIMIDTMANLPISQTSNSNDPRQKGQAKYFMDTIFLNKTTVPQTIPGTESHKTVVTNLDEDETSKLNADLISNINSDPSQAYDDNHLLNNINNNAIVQNNSTHY
ncbi:uncharacterized protein LOC133532931 [Cydia pomonella]|uniref:uncharacterized protein LOC133532931 n=1 Tax=Cydia pomonella TaxID=82600 RepID=UPI002ADDDB1C|nr:uncharacterized protein LOC133532931 [Cydia pomonella]XP_061727783.1 uncharacterized protein LOC133532931 [Cydia pomonella]